MQESFAHRSVEFEGKGPIEVVRDICHAACHVTYPRAALVRVLSFPLQAIFTFAGCDHERKWARSERDTLLKITCRPDYRLNDYDEKWFEMSVVPDALKGLSRV